jgi:hypothetical protein
MTVNTKKGGKKKVQNSMVILSVTKKGAGKAKRDDNEEVKHKFFTRDH